MASSSTAVAYDPFGLYGGTNGVSKGTTRANSTGGTAKSNAGVEYDPFNIRQQNLSTPLPTPTPAPAKVVAPKAKAPSLLNKVGGGIKTAASGFKQGLSSSKPGRLLSGIANAASTSEQAAATGIARSLPGGTADIKAQADNAAQSSKDLNFVQGLVKSGKVPKAQATKLINAIASNTSNASSEQTQTVKALPTTGQVASGIVGTGADILTGGELGLLNKGSKLARTAVATGNAAAGGLNAAAGGGSKKQILENTVAGAALPEVLHGVAKVGEKGVNAVADKTGITGAKSVIKNQRVQNLIKTAQKIQESKPPVATGVANPEHVAQGLIRPTVKQKLLSDISVPADNIEKLDNGTVNTMAKQIKNGEPVPAVVTHELNGMTHVVDGQHTIAAAQKAGATSVPTVEKVPGAVPLAPEVAPKVAPANTMTGKDMTEALNSHYTPGKTATPDEAKAITYLRQNPEKAITDYNARVQEKFGASNIVAGDEAKYVIPGFDSTKSGTYHEPGSALAKVKYDQLLADPATKDKPVLIMAGGTGAGKTSALKNTGVKYEDYAAVIDTNSNKTAGTEARIHQALLSGRKVQLAYVNRDPIKAFTEGVIPRGRTEGRIVAVHDHLETHYGAHDVFHELSDKYKDNAHVEMGAVDNNHGAGQSKPVTIDNLPTMKYTKSEARTLLEREVENAYQKGQISPAERQIYLGKQTDNTSVRPNAERQPEQERSSATKAVAQEPVHEPATTKAVVNPKAPPETGTSKIAQDIQAKAVAKNLNSTYGEMTQYNKLNVANEADKAVKFVNGDKAELEQVISGQKPLPTNLRATAVIKAVEEHPIYGKDGDMLKQLANSPLNSESSRSAQELRLAAERETTSPVKVIKQIQDAKAEALQKHTGKTAAKAVSDEVKQIRAAKVPVTPKTWDDFVESIKCH